MRLHAFRLPHLSARLSPPSCRGLPTIIRSKQKTGPAPPPLRWDHRAASLRCYCSALPAPMILPPQTFRSSGNKKSPSFVPETLPGSLVVLLYNRKVLVRAPDEGNGDGPPSVAWFPAGEVEALGLGGEVAADGRALQGGRVADAAPPSPSAADAPPHFEAYLLGKSPTGEWRYAVDVTPGGGAAMEQLAAAGLATSDIRPLMLNSPMEDAALAGQAMALAQWHAGVKFCGGCGKPTRSIEAGLKRACTDPACGRRVYPRTDPVVIMIAESPCGGKCLLGRVKRFRSGMYTALSGFVEQGESLEEAVVREVQEEAGVGVSSIHVVGSQPWPVGRASLERAGRGGTCELMIGAVAKATSLELDVDTDEMEDVRWFTRAEVQAAVARSGSLGNPFKDPVLREGEVAEAAEALWVPGPYAIAHHLIKAWADGSIHQARM